MQAAAPRFQRSRLTALAELGSPRGPVLRTALAAAHRITAIKTRSATIVKMITMIIMITMIVMVIVLIMIITMIIMIIVMVIMTNGPRGTPV